MKLITGDDVQVGPYAGNVIKVEEFKGYAEITVYIDESELK